MKLFINTEKRTRNIYLAFAAMLVFAIPSYAREIVYTGNEEPIYIRPGEPTQIKFPSNIAGGYRRSRTALRLQRRDNFLVIFAQPELSPDGEGIIVHLEDKRSFALRMVPSSEDQERDAMVNVQDVRDEDYETKEDETYADDNYAPPTVVSGLMRNMILVAEFGKQKGISGYRRSNRYSGEVLLNDGTMEAKLDEIFISGGLWGYVLSVENLLETNQKINPANFRLDGTRGVLAQDWELAPRPVTAEQQLSGKHKTKVYIVTKSKGR